MENSTYQTLCKLDVHCKPWFKSAWDAEVELEWSRLMCNTHSLHLRGWREVVRATTGFPGDVGRELLPQFSQKKKIPKLGKGGWKNAAVSTRLQTHCGRTTRYRVFWPLWCKLHMMLPDQLTCWYIRKTSKLLWMSCYTRKAMEICILIYFIYLGKECLRHGHICLPRNSLTGYNG